MSRTNNSNSTSHRRLQVRAEAASISEENAGRAFELLRARLSDDELVAFRSLHRAGWYEFRKALEEWEPLSAPASIEPPPVSL
jgi:hypothetical protein